MTEPVRDFVRRWPSTTIYLLLIVVLELVLIALELADH